ncbi:hypothetical protein AGMMS50212_12570 [Spirochaetia bacterium]|nr:hypothetical protein AGMMS50212_12570 [Spirochaetia bacterium]
MKFTDEIRRRAKAIIKNCFPAPLKRYIWINYYKKSSSRRLTKRSLISFEVNVTDHCNLNCRSCEHFSPIADEKFLDIDTYTKDVERLSFLFDKKIEYIHLMGGEPLLHPRLDEIIEVSRKYFPEGVIEIVTNGLLVLREDGHFWDVCCKNNITIAITQYPIKLDYKRIEEKANAKNVRLRYYFLGKKTMHKRPFDLRGTQNIEENFAVCHMANTCMQLFDGKLSTCVIIPYIHIFNKFFNQTMQVCEKDYIDIYKAKDKQEIFDFLCRPIPFCRYCNIKKTKLGLNWAVSKQQIGEWT